MIQKRLGFISVNTSVSVYKLSTLYLACMKQNTLSCKIFPIAVEHLFQLVVWKISNAGAGILGILGILGIPGIAIKWKKKKRGGGGGGGDAIK